MRRIYIVTPWAGETSALVPAYNAAVDGAVPVIIDNNSSLATAKALEDLPGHYYMRNDVNVGFAGANLQGWHIVSEQATDDDILIYLNSDVQKSGDWLRLVERDVRHGAIYGPSLGQQLVGGRWLPYIEGWCMAMTVRTARVYQIAFDHERYPGPYWEDNALCLAAMEAGLPLIQVDWPIQHLGGRTAGALHRHGTSYEHNRQQYVEAVMANTYKTPGNLFGHYLQAANTQSDIQHHLPLLFSSARGTVVELGTRSGLSTAALLAGVEIRGGHVTSIDIADCSHLYRGHTQWTFIQSDSTAPYIADRVLDDGQRIDVLFIDTEHTYQQAKLELNYWSPRMRDTGVILMHDTETFPGVKRAAIEFARSQDWRLDFVVPCNGFAILRRRHDR